MTVTTKSKYSLSCKSYNLYLHKYIPVINNNFLRNVPKSICIFDGNDDTSRGDELRLEQAIDVYWGVIQIDVKVDEGTKTSSVDPSRLHNVLAEKGVVGRVIVTSQDLKFLETLWRLDGRIKLGYDPALEELPQNKAELEAFCRRLINLAERMGLFIVCLNYKIAEMIIGAGLVDEFISEMRRVGCWVNVWTVNNGPEIRKFLEHGFVVTTDLDLVELGE